MPAQRRPQGHHVPAHPAGGAVRAQQVRQFFNAYAQAFNHLDGDAVADLWHVPSGIADAPAGQARLTWWTDDAALRANHHALCAHYRSAGFHRTTFDICHHEALGAGHDFVRVQWRITRADGSLLQAFGTAYQLIHTPAGPRVLLCTAFQEDLKEMTPHAAE